MKINFLKSYFNSFLLLNHTIYIDKNTSIFINFKKINELNKKYSYLEFYL